MTQRHNHDNSVADTYKDLANLIDHTRLRSFPKALEDFLATLCHFDTMLMVTFKKSLKPIILHPTNPAEQSPTLEVKSMRNKSNRLEELFVSLVEKNLD